MRSSTLSVIWLIVSLAHRRAVDLGGVRTDLALVSPLAYNDSTIWSTPVKRPLPLAHDPRLERARPVPGHFDGHLAAGLGQHRLGPGPVPHVPGLVTSRAVLVMTEMLGQLLIQRRLQHHLGQLLQQPLRTGQRHPPSRTRATSSSASFCSGVGSSLSFFLVPSSSVASVSAPLPPGRRAGAVGAGNTVCCTVPSTLGSWTYWQIHLRREVRRGARSYVSGQRQRARHGVGTAGHAAGCLT